MPGRSRGVQQTTPRSLRSKNSPTLIHRLGPGLITGAADDDPAGIGTYSQVGAQFGFGMLWTMLFSFPLMTAMQEICARLGRITGVGIADILSKHYPKPLTYGIVFLLCIANIFNLGADLSAMGAAVQLVSGGRPGLSVLLLGTASLLLQVFVPYRKYVRYLKWLTLVLLAYFGTAFVVRVPWGTVLRAAILPSFEWSVSYWMALVAVLGTTISPYLFFWQTSEEAEEVRIASEESPLKKKPWQAFGQFRRIAMDTRVGMAFSNAVAFFIILTTAVTLHSSKNGNVIQSAADAAKALKPLAGEMAFLLFALGIIGTGMLAIPVLAGSTAYAVCGAFQLRGSLESKPSQAPQFYLVLSAATIAGATMVLVGINPIRALFWSAALNGLVAVPLMIVLMLVSDNASVVGKFRLPIYLRVLGWTAAGVMFLASGVFLVSAAVFPGK
jgi:NRAMP (natural resistance-associated macrophage protein)-like metal ion transporter